MIKNNLIYIIATFILVSSCSVLNNIGGSVDRSEAPAAGAAPSINLGSYDSFDLPNGLRVIVVENHKIPKVSYQLSMDIPPILEGEKTGYVSMAGSLLNSGTQNMNKAQLAEEVDFIGARLNTSSNSVYASSLKKHSEKLLDIMSDIVLHPTFPPEEIEKERKATLSGIASEQTSVDAISSRITAVANYGLDHPYGEQMTVESVENINRNDLLGYYNTWFKPNIATLVIVGDITKDEAKIQAENYFGTWEKGDTPSLDYKDPVPPASNRVVFVPVEGAVQSVIKVTHPVEFSVADDDYIAARVMNSILGGGAFSGRLMQNLREDKAYTYGARSSLSADKYIGSFTAYASVRNEVSDSSITQFIYELERLVNQDVSAETLQLVKNNMNGTFALSLERPETIARFARNIEKYNLPSDFYETYLDRLSQVTIEDVRKAAQKYIFPENLNIVVVGNREEVAENLAQFNVDKKVEFFDMYGQPWKDRRDAPEGVTAQSVLESYIAARGGEQKLGEVSTYSQTGAMTMMGADLPMKVLVKDGNKIKTIFEMGGQVMMEQVVNVDQGISKQMGQQAEMSAEEVLDAILQVDLLAELRYADYGIEPILLGVDAVEGKDVYVIELRREDDVVGTDFYSVKDGLKVQTIVNQETPMGMQVIKTSYDSYEPMGGILFAKEVDIAAGPQNMVVTLDDVTLDPEIADSEFQW